MKKEEENDVVKKEEVDDDDDDEEESEEEEEEEEEQKPIKKKASGFNKELEWSDAMADFLGMKMCSRPQVRTRWIIHPYMHNTYIHHHHH